MSRLFRFLLLSCLVSFFCGRTYSAAPLNVSVDKHSVETGEIFTYEIELEGSFSEPEIKVPDFKNFKVVSQSQSKSYSFEGGEAKVRAIFTYHLFASQPGVYSIEEVRVKDNGAEYKSRAVTIEVKGASLEKKRKILPYIEKGYEI